MSEEQLLRVETTGETVGEAKWTALRELEKLQPGLDKAQVRFEVVSEGERGLLGVGFTPARVIATADSGAALPVPDEIDSHGPESEGAGRTRDVLERITRALGVQARFEISEDEETILVSCTGRDLGLLIGKHGQTIDAIQYLANAIVFRGRPEERKSIVVDAAGYRARRQAALDALAVRSAERALQTDSRVELEPMTPVERKVVHIRLKEFPGVETSSEGTEPNRFVVVQPARE